MELPDRQQLQALYSPAVITATARVRPKLIKAIRKGAFKQHIYVYAPTGFGKTASVLRWLNDVHGDKAWIGLKKKDNNLDEFFLKLILAFLSIQLDNEILTEKLRRATSEDNIWHFAETAAAYCLSPSGVKSLVVLDSFENITDESLIRYFVKVMRALPDDFTITVISRQEPHELFSDLILRNLMSVVKKDSVII